MALQASPVKQLAARHGLPVFQPASLKDPLAQETVREVAADVMVVAAYGLILPQVVLDLPRYGCLNIHASLLPRWRGAAPIQRAILAGDVESGVCIMQMEAGLDTGPVPMSGKVPIDGQTTAASLHDALAALGGRLIVEALARLPLLPTRNLRPGSPMPPRSKRRRRSSIGGSRQRRSIARSVPSILFPGAVTTLAGTQVKLWQATPVMATGAPGELLALERDSLVIACGEGALRVTELQRPGQATAVARFLAGHPMNVGEIFGAGA